ADKSAGGNQGSRDWSRSLQTLRPPTTPLPFGLGELRRLVSAGPFTPKTLAFKLHPTSLDTNPPDDSHLRFDAYLDECSGCRTELPVLSKGVWRRGVLS